MTIICETPLERARKKETVYIKLPPRPSCPVAPATSLERAVATPPLARIDGSETQNGKEERYLSTVPAPVTTFHYLVEMPYSRILYDDASASSEQTLASDTFRYGLERHCMETCAQTPEIITGSACLVPRTVQRFFGPKVSFMIPVSVTGTSEAIKKVEKYCTKNCSIISKQTSYSRLEALLPKGTIERPKTFADKVKDESLLDITSASLPLAMSFAVGVIIIVTAYKLFTNE